MDAEAASRRREMLAVILGCGAVVVPIAALSVMHLIELRAKSCPEYWNDFSEAAYNWIGVATPFCAAALGFGAVLLTRARYGCLLAAVASTGTFLLVGFLTLATAYEVEGCY